MLRLLLRLLFVFHFLCIIFVSLDAVAFAFYLYIHYVLSTVYPPYVISVSPGPVKYLNKQINEFQFPKSHCKHVINATEASKCT